MTAGRRGPPRALRPPLFSVVEGRGEKIAAVKAADNEGGEDGDSSDDAVVDGELTDTSASEQEVQVDLSAEQNRLEELEKEIYQMAGREFKITSYVELSRVLFEDLKLPIVKQPSNKVLGGVSTSSRHSLCGGARNV